jgi:hypothetical protein
MIKKAEIYTGAVLQTTDGAGDILVGMVFKGDPAYPTGLKIFEGMEFKKSSLPELKKKINFGGTELAKERGMTYEPLFSF